MLTPMPAAKNLPRRLAELLCAAISARAAIRAKGRAERRLSTDRWRATVNEDRHYCFAVAL
jgi:hypothetical protein